MLQVVAIQRKHVEGAELNLLVVLARMQGVEIGDAIDTQDNSLAVNGKVLVAVLSQFRPRTWASRRPSLPASPSDGSASQRRSEQARVSAVLRSRAPHTVDALPVDSPNYLALKERYIRRRVF
jgi:hypothetical protein